MIKYLHEYEGETVMLVIYDTATGPGLGKLKQIVKAGEGQVTKLMALSDYVP